MSENGTVTAAEETQATQATQETQETQETAVEATAETEIPVEPEDISYHAVEKEGSVAAIWEMQGRKHVRTINPRSHEGKQILALFETAG